jgi:hypothetical protein
MPTTLAPIEPKRREYAVSARVRKALTLLASGEASTQVQACEMASLTPRALAKALKRDSVKQLLQNEIRETLGLSATRAAQKMRALIDSPNQMTAFRASAYSLAVGAGVQPPAAPSTTVNILNAASATGYLIDLTSGPAGFADADLSQISSVGGILVDRPGSALIEHEAGPRRDDQ